MASNQVAITLTIAYWIASGSLRRDPGQLFGAMDLDRLGFSGSILSNSTYSDSLVHSAA
jgi:hypothetical protein